MRRFLATVAMAVLALTAGCSALPDSGPVHTGKEYRDAEYDSLGQGVPVPRTDASPAGIVQGFLQASSVESDDALAGAREFLTPDAGREWDPNAQLLVYSLQDDLSWPESAPVTDATRTIDVRISANVVGTLDSEGHYSATTGTRQAFTFGLHRNSDQQWRISSMPPGRILADGDFASQYRAGTLYFPDRPGASLVPDVRYFPSSTAATSLVQAFLAGPSSWLSDAVTVPAPAGTKLDSAGVTVENSVAEVNLSDRLRGLESQDRSLLLTCLQASLTKLPGISSVQLVVAGAAFEASVLPGMAPKDNANAPLYVLNGEQIVRLSATSQDVIFQDSVLPSWSTLSIAPGARKAAGLTDSGALALFSAEDRQVILAQDGGYAPPRFGADGLLWTAKDGWVLAYGADGEPIRLTAPWLRDSKIQAIVPASDGTRLGMILSKDGSTVLQVTAIVRDKDRLPASLTNPLEMPEGPGIPLDAVWLDSVTLMDSRSAAAQQAGTVQSAVVGGLAQNIPAGEGLHALAAQGAGTVHALDAQGRIYRLQGQNWISLPGKARALAFPAS